MQNLNRNAHRSKGLKKRKRRLASFLESDKGLLGVFLAAAFIVSTSVFIVPWTLEGEGNNVMTLEQYKHISDISQVKQEVALTKKPTKKNSGNANSSSTIFQSSQQTIRQNVIVKSSEEGFFRNHSTPYHTIFSTGCSVFQDWQSYVFFYHVMGSGQEGHVTRIASGCSGENTDELKNLFKKEIESMRPGVHHLQLTPDFSRIPKKRKGAFKYFNKPFGVRHWMKSALGYPENHELHDDSIIILMDPDQIMLRPFTNDFTNSSEEWRSKKLNKLKVEHGSPFSQQYGYGIQWLRKVNHDYVFQGSNFSSPVSNMTVNEAMTYYIGMGPPYIATAKDMWSIVNTWCDIVPLVHDEYPHLLAE